MQQIGYRLVRVADDAVVDQWGGNWGALASPPNPLILPNGDQVCGAEVGGEYDGHRLEAWLASPSAPQVVAECERRLSAGFSYDFGDSRGVHQIGTTDADMKGWDEVSKASQAAIAVGMPTAPMHIVTETGPVTITALEWQQILLAATVARQPIWAASFALQAMSPIPDDYTSDAYWSA